MSKRVILITGTPCTGKTSVSKQLTAKLDALYINLTDLAKKLNLIIKEDKERNTSIINEEEIRTQIAEIIDAANKNTIIVDGHYAAAVVPQHYVTRIFVLRRNPIELRSFMEKCGFQGDKLWENLASEILDVCLVEALNEHKREKVCEVDVTGKTVEDAASEVMAVLDNQKKCSAGGVDWLGMLEKEDLLEEYLKI